MMTERITESLERAVEIWNEKLSEIYTLLTLAPDEFRNGTVWAVIEKIHGALQATGYALLVLFFTAGVMKTCSTFADLKRPEHAVKMFVRFAIAKALVTYGMELMEAILAIVQAVISSIMDAASVSGAVTPGLPEAVAEAAADCTFLESVPVWAVSIIGTVVIWVLSLTLVLTVYGRFFRLYMYTALSPLPLSAFAGEPTAPVAVSFLKSYAGVCLEGAVIVLSCVIFSCFASTPPQFAAEESCVSMLWSYMGETILNMLILVGCIKMSDRLVHEMLGL